MMNEICKNTFRIWRFWKKNFQVWVLQNNSLLDRLKNVIKNQIFPKNWNLRLVYDLKFAQELIPGLIKSKIDVWKHIVIPWTIVYFFFLLFLIIFKNRPKFQRKFWNFPPSAAPANWKRRFFFGSFSEFSKIALNFKENFEKIFHLQRPQNFHLQRPQNFLLQRPQNFFIQRP